MEVDELYTLKNAYWMGNYEEAIAEAKSLRLKTDALKAERDAFIARSNIGLGNFEVRAGGRDVDLVLHARTPRVFLGCLCCCSKS